MREHGFSHACTLPFTLGMSLRGFEAWWADGLVAARWIAACEGLRSALWTETSSTTPRTLRRAAARVDAINELVAIVGQEPLVYSVVPCDRPGCCAEELPRFAPTSPTSGVRRVSPHRASSAPPGP